MNPEGFGVFDQEFASSSLLTHVGRSLTIHAGTSKSTPTIAAAACGLAHPHAMLDTAGAMASISGAQTTLVSPSVAAGIIILILVGVGFLVVATLYYFRKPIPLCGRCLYREDNKYKSAPPPPPGGGGATQLTHPAMTVEGV